MKTFPLVFFLLAAMPWVGCVKKGPLRGPETTPEQAQEPQKKDPLAHLLGPWELPDNSGKIKKMVFAAGGKVTFQGGLEYFNPAHWELDAAQEELKITFPQATDKNLDIFHMYIGDGVKAFDRPRKQVTYHFDADTWGLNVGGWTYAKPDTTAVRAEAEPVFR